jgi:hypothetical protein
LANRTALAGTFTSGSTHLHTDDNSAPGGWIGYASLTSDSATYTTSLVDISGLSQAVTVNTTRRIRISVSLQVAGESAALGDIFIREGSTSIKKSRYQFATGSGTCSVSMWTILTPSAGSHTYKVSAQRATGTVAHNILASSGASATDFGPAELVIEDIGPAS